MNKKQIINNLKKSFIIECYPLYALAHGDYDWEHYYVKYFCHKTKKIIETHWCDAGVCGNLPFKNNNHELDKFFEMGKIEYWESKGIPKKYIKIKN